MRSMKIYTRTGDDGSTGLFGGARVSKASLRVDTYGTVDEANAAIGRARGTITKALATEHGGLLAQIQSDLFTLGAELATAQGKEEKLRMKLLEEADSTPLERAIDAAEEGLAPLKNFVLPGGSAGAADLHYARCVVRRAERLLVGLGEHEQVRKALVVYLNRLSDLLFTLARRDNHHAGIEDVPWIVRS
jgi:cob(I)alamin adenosyltransferase